MAERRRSDDDQSMGLSDQEIEFDTIKNLNRTKASEDSEGKQKEKNTTSASTIHKQNEWSKFKDDQVPLEKPLDQTERFLPRPSTSGKAPDQTERFWRGPSTSASFLLVGPKEGPHLERTLKANEVNSKKPVLCLGSDYISCILIDCPSFLEDHQVESLQILDEENRMYMMKLSLSFSRESQTLEPFFDSSQWQRFVIDHSLKEGDKLSFYRQLDPDVYRDDFYYNLRIVRKSSGNKDDGRKAEQSDLKVDEISKEDASVPPRKMPAFKVTYHRVLLTERSPHQWAGSRDFPLEASCLTKTLHSSEIVPGNTKLQFDIFDAIILTDDPKIAERKYSRSFLVFDVNDRDYKMRLSRHSTVEGRISYCLDGWSTFLRNHELKEGDELIFYKFLDSEISSESLDPSVCEGYYFVITYARMQPAYVFQFNDEPSDAGWEKQIVGKPGSRDLYVDDLCFRKHLSRDDVAPRDPCMRLHFTASESRFFESRIRIPKRRIIVYDVENTRFEITLSRTVSCEGTVLYTFDDGWQAFVTTNGLNFFDEISVYRIYDEDSLVS